MTLTKPCPRCHGAGTVPLAPRIERVIKLVADGLANKEIGYRLGISTGAVKEYVSLAMAATGANNRTDLARRVWEARCTQ